MNAGKYRKPYFMPEEVTFDWTKKTEIEKAPKWCSVDLRDGNQALIEPMSLDEKLEFYELLLEVGFKEIEVGFPAASETEYQFMRTLIERNMIPQDVTVQVLTQAREHIIEKTFEAVKGAPSAIIHLYNSTSVAQREQVFHKSKEEIKKLAVDGAKMVKDFADHTEGNFRFEYSPESFHGTEVEYAVEVCNAVLDVWQPTPDRKAIINIPTTVENAMPHVFGCQLEYVHKHLKYRDAVELSIHPHNDRGCGVATAEVGVLAGADRVEGTLFGNGERTGNVDLVNVGMNMFSHGYDPVLDFSNMKKMVETYERLTGMQVSPRQPYAGELVFTAFSGSHQDAIAKGLALKEERARQGEDIWDVPYLPIDPKDVGRTYDSDVIRINSQSGKGGVAFIMEQKYGITMPKKMREDFGYCVKSVSDHKHKELMPDEIYQIFHDNYVNVESPYKLVDFMLKKDVDGSRSGVIDLEINGKPTTFEAKGNGRLDAVSNAIQANTDIKYTDLIYSEHALEIGSTSRAMAYIGIKGTDGKITWGAGMDTDIITASVLALFSAINRMKA